MRNIRGTSSRLPGDFPAWPRGVFQSLYVRNYRIYASAHLTKMLGIWMMFTAQDWMVLQLSDNSAHALSWLVALQFLPVPLLALFAGRLADRFDKRYLLFLANLIWVIFSAILSFLVITDLIELWHVFVFAGILGLVNSVEGPTRQSFVSELVEKSTLPNALSLASAALQIGRILGPALAGVGIAWFGLGAVFAMSTVLCLTPVLSYPRIDPAELYSTERAKGAARPKAGILDGMRYVRSRPDLARPLILMFAVSLVAYNYPITLPMLAKTVFHRDAATFGLLMTSLAIGALSGAFAGSSRRTRPSATLIVKASLALGTSVTLLGLIDSYRLTCLILVVVGFCTVFFNQASNQRIQMGVDPSHRGRVMSLYMVAFVGTTPIGGPLIGAAIERFDVQTVVVATGLITLCLGLLASLVERRSPWLASEAVELDTGPHDVDVTTPAVAPSGASQQLS